ncbi:hypothetical protein EAG_15086 [Camponotus floridanus]|uniref:Uncharacterized protein n=1 Tax=Camponotus floridanus TaxID=104421 RepID=E2AGY9_CAMFO|nr:hypothetical protein EAG_15086 [Camponotus floridanus]
MCEGHGLTHEEETCTDTWDKRSRRWCLRPQIRVSTVRIKRNPPPMKGKWLCGPVAFGILEDSAYYFLYSI